MDNAMTDKLIGNLAKEIFHQSTDDVINRWKNDAEQAANPLHCGIRLVNTGYYNNGEKTELSFPRKALTIIAGRTGGGKTKIMLNIAVSLALKGHRGIFVTLEEPEFQLAAKTMAIYDCYMQGKEIATPYNDFKFMLKTGKIKNWKLLEQYQDQIVRNIIFVDANSHTQSIDCAQPNELYDPHAITEFAHYIDGELDFIIGDYIQLMQTGEYEVSPYVNIKKVMSSIRYMNGQHSAAIIMGAQFNREVTNLDIRDWEPEHLREAADIEQGTAMLIAAAQTTDKIGKPNTILRVLKNRYGNPFQSGVFNVSYPHQFIEHEPIGCLTDD